MNLIVSPEAVADLERLRTFLADKSPRAAQRAVATIIGAIESLSMFPDRGRPTPTAHVRELIAPFGRSAYVLRYTHLAHSRELIILRVWHGREHRD